jgi:hypothetical protein
MNRCGGMRKKRAHFFAQCTRLKSALQRFAGDMAALGKGAILMPI